MRLPGSATVTLAAVLLAGSCGTSGVSLSDDDAAAGTVTTTTTAPTPTSTTATGTSSSTTTTSTVTTSTTTTTTSTTTTTTAVAAPLEFDDEGVPVNGQTSGVVLTPSGWLTPILGPNIGGGWRVWTPCGSEAVVRDGQVIESVDIVLDPGHGGPTEPGAVGPNGLVEAELNLAVAERTATALEAAGYKAVLTRDRDARLPIVTRGEIALALDPIAFISIHHNAGIDSGSRLPGTEMYHQIDDPESKRLAGLLYEETRAVLDPFDVAWVSMSDAGAMVRPNREGGDYYGVLRRPAGVTSVLAEIAYISNGPEAVLLEQSDVQGQLAGAIVAAVDRLIGTTDPGSGFVDDPIFRGYGPSGAGHTDGCVDPELE